MGDGVHAAVLTTDLDFSFARRFFKHVVRTLPRR